VKWCMKFDLNSNKWEPLPKLNHARESCGSFMSKEKRYICVFGGSHNSVERLHFTRPHEGWEVLDVEFPGDLDGKAGLTTLPMWHYPVQIDGIDEDDVLIFGGSYKEILRFNYDTKEI